ncbi:triose-phosphate isomerase [Candidatus Woesearchaeota archaeon]|nr:MAG: triose-phosphate isomerase [Candidatus Woesearchaeota archaeon]
MLKTPFVLVNFKAYKEATGKQAMILAKACDRAAKETNANIAIAPQLLDIERIYEVVDIPIVAQHVDPINLGKHTGFILPEAVRSAGAIGTLINHSEHPVRFIDIEKTIERCIETGLKSIVCAPNSADARLIDALQPNFIAIEPPELIAGRISVSKAKPHIIQNIAKYLKTPLLVGAGIHNSKDIKLAIDLGAKGVLLSSAVVKARKPKDALVMIVKDVMK